MTIDTTEDVTIPEGTYDTELTVKGSGAVTNKATFTSVELAGKNKYTENKDNQIVINDEATLVVTKDTKLTNVQVAVADKDKKVSIENNGNINTLDILSAGKVEVTGKSAQTDMKVNVSSDDVELKTNEPAIVSATAKTQLTFTSTMDGTEVTINKTANKPVVYGTGSYILNDKETGKKDTLTATPLEDVGKVTVKGTIKEAVKSTADETEESTTKKNSKRKNAKAGKGLGGVTVVFTSLDNGETKRLKQRMMEVTKLKLMLVTIKLRLKEQLSLSL